VRDLNNKQGNNRYRGKGAKWTIIGDHKFVSRGEAERYLELRTEKSEGKIQDFEMQVKFLLIDAYVNGVGTKIRPMNYIADFVIINLDGSTTVEDVKGWGGFTTPDFKLKKKLFESVHYPLVIKEVQRKGKLPKDFSAPFYGWGETLKKAESVPEDSRLS